MKESTIFHAGCKILAFALVCISSCLPVSALANVFDYSNSGIVKASSGNYYLVEGSKVTAISPEKALSMQHKFPVNTTRGAQEVAFVRQATPYMPKIGNAVATLAKRVGPLGMSLSAAQLICDLTTICNQAGQWMLSPDSSIAGYPATSPNYKWAGYNGAYFPNPYTACNSPAYLTYRNSVSASPSPVTETNYSCGFVTSTGAHVDGWTGRVSGCADRYVLTGSTCTLQGNSTSQPPSASDWTTAETKLNDPRSVDILVEEFEPVPINLPTITNAPLRQLIQDTYDPQFDSTGTQTGTKRQTTELVLEDAATADKPNQVNVKEETTTRYYDNTGTLTGTITTSTTEVNQQSPQPAQQLCGLTGQEPCNVLIDERGVQTAIAALDPLGQTATNNVTAAFDSANNSILSCSGGVGAGFQWPWQVNAGSCSPLVIDAQKGLVIDPCPHIPLIHQILGYVFYVLTAIAIFNVFFQPKTA